MGDSYGDQRNQRSSEGYREGARGGFRGGRAPGGRDSGGFRIRLSENEMRASRALQEAFNLRSTVAVLGFAVRTLAQMLEDGQLDELANQHRNLQGNSGNRRNENKYASRRNRSDNEGNAAGTFGAKPNPFARPQKPQSTQTAEKTSNEQTVETTPQEQEDSPTSNNSSGDTNESASINEEKIPDQTNTSSDDGLNSSKDEN